MSKISDSIEEFILEQLQDDGFVNLSRNELANFFSCAPSQINYVLSTRFTEPKGFLIESHRGGGGYIKLVRININKNTYIRELLTSILIDEVDYSTTIQILRNLVDIQLLTKESGNLLGYALSPKALAMPIKIENKLRANILRNILINLSRGE